MNADSIRIECEEDGFHLVVDTDHAEAEFRFRITDPEALYDHVKAAIGPWLYERDQAKRDFAYNQVSGDAYELSDPKHPDFHSVHADIWDARAGK